MNRLEVVEFPAPYSDKQSIEEIAHHTRKMLDSQLPAFQVDVGADRHLAGTLAVRQIIEYEVNNAWDKGPSPVSPIPFRFTHQNMRAPFFVLPQHARANRISPHVDGMQLGPAIHKEYLGSPTKVQFGYVPEGIELPVAENYTGPDLSQYIDNVHEGVTHLGRLSVFSQGNANWNMRPSAHYFEREIQPDIGGRYTRYSMFDPKHGAFPAPDEFESFAAMRKNASVHLDLWQWKLVRDELEAYKEKIPFEDYTRYSAMADDHIANHPGANYKYWMMTDVDLKDYTYGVAPL